MAQDLSFTNNLGTITLSRVMYSIAHSYTWAGEGPARQNVEISATGKLRNSEAELNSVAGSGGVAGTLVLPHTVLHGVKIRELSYEDGVWAPWGTVTASFDTSDDTGSSDTSIDFVAITPRGATKTLKIYNPAVTFSPSKIRRGESQIYGMNGWVRQQLGHDMISINLSGEVATSPCTYPEDIMEFMEQKIRRRESSGMEYFRISEYPRVGDLSSFIPAAKDNYELKNVMIVDGRLTWQYEDNVADIEIEMLAPPQKVTDHLGGE